jgi:hypothetical protein
LVPKEGKGAKEGRIVHEETFALGRRSFWSLDLRFCTWLRKGRPLAFVDSSLRQLAYLFQWRDFIFEEGAWHLLTVCYLEKFLAIRILRCQLESDHSSRTAIPVEGIHILTSQQSSGADLAVSEGAHHIFLLLAV